MTMQYDVKASQLAGSGLMASGRVRLKQATFVGSGTAGYIEIFDTTAAPIAATYARSGAIITVTSTAHGLTTGTVVGIAYIAASGVSGVAGNYPIIVIDVNTFTITDLNSGTIAGGTVCNYSAVGKWLTGYNTSSGIQPFQVLVPGEGLLCLNGVYVLTSNVPYVSVSYG
jgi:hypothetical protein